MLLLLMGIGFLFCGCPSCFITCSGTIVVYAEVCGWESLSGSLSVSSMVQDEGTWRLGSLVEEVC